MLLFSPPLVLSLLLPPVLYIRTSFEKARDSELYFGFFSVSIYFIYYSIL